MNAVRGSGSSRLLSPNVDPALYQNLVEMIPLMETFMVHTELNSLLDLQSVSELGFFLSCLLVFSSIYGSPRLCIGSGAAAHFR